MEPQKVRQRVEVEIDLLKETRDRISRELSKHSREVALLAEEGFEIASGQLSNDVLLPLVETLAAYWVTDFATKTREEEIRLLEKEPLP